MLSSMFFFVVDGIFSSFSMCHLSGGEYRLQQLNKNQSSQTHLRLKHTDNVYNVRFDLARFQYLVGGLEHDFYFSIYWGQSSQLTFIFFKGFQTTSQIMSHWISPGFNNLIFEICKLKPHRIDTGGIKPLKGFIQCWG